MTTLSWKWCNTTWMKDFTRSYQSADLINQLSPFRQFLSCDGLGSQILGYWPKRLCCGCLLHDSRFILFCCSILSNAYSNKDIPTVSRTRSTKWKQRFAVMIEWFRWREWYTKWFKITRCRILWSLAVFSCLGPESCGWLPRNELKQLNVVCEVGKPPNFSIQNATIKLKYTLNDWIVTEISILTSYLLSTVSTRPFAHTHTRTKAINVRFDVQ